MAARAPLDPSRLAPFFVFAVLLHAAAIVTRFDEVARQLPPIMTSSVLLGTVAMLFIEGYFEGRLDYGPTLADLPLWMRIKSGPVKAAFTFAFTYLAVVALQTWDVSIGPIDPTPPPEMPLETRAMWFGMFTFGMFFVNYLAATSILVPFFRAVTKPLRALPGVVGVAIASVVGVGVGWGLSELVASVLLQDQVAGVQDSWAQITSAPAVASRSRWRSRSCRSSWASCSRPTRNVARTRDHATGFAELDVRSVVTRDALAAGSALGVDVHALAPRGVLARLEVHLFAIHRG